MAFQYINTGTSANSGNGDSIRSAFTKVNQSFSYIEDLISSSALNPDPTFNSITVTNAATLLSGAYLNTSSALLTYDSQIDGLAINGNSILGNYRFSGDTVVTPKNAIIGPTTGFSFDPRLLFLERQNFSNTSSEAVLLSGDSQLTLKTEIDLFGISSAISLINGNTFSLENLSGLTLISDQGTVSNVGSFEAVAGSTFGLSTASARSADFSAGLFSLNGEVLTGVFSNSSGTWINGGTEGVTIANENFGWQFTADGRIIFPDGTAQFGAASSTSTFVGDLVPSANLSYNIGTTSSFWNNLYLGGSTISANEGRLSVNGSSGFTDRLTSSTSELLLNQQGHLVLDQNGAYDGSEISGTLFRIDTDQPNYTQMTIHNLNSSTTATSDIIFVRNNGSVDLATGVLDIGINSSNYTEEPFGVHTPGSAYIYTADADLIVGTQNPGKRLIFHAGGTTTLDAAGYLDEFAWRFNRDVQVVFTTPAPLNFTVQNLSGNSAAQAVYQAVNNLGDYIHFGINSSNPNSNYGNIGPGDSFIHNHSTTATFHIGSEGNLAFYSDEINGFSGTPTLVMSRVDRSSTFAGHVLPAEDLVYDLGSSSTQWRSLWVGTSTIYIGGIPVTINTVSNTLAVGVTPGTTATTATNLATESFVIDYVNQFGGSGLEIDGNDANSTTANEIRPFGEAAFYLDTNWPSDKLTLMIFDGVRNHRDSKVLAPGILWGSGGDAGDGSGADTIKLIPDAEILANGSNQYIIIDPTGGDPGHIHIRAGGTQDASAADLYLGGELTCVRVSDTSDSVTIRTTNIGDSNITMNWIFDNQGNLYLPGIGTNSIGESEPGMVLSSDMGIALVSNSMGDSKTLIFDNTGKLHLNGTEINATSPQAQIGSIINVPLNAAGDTVDYTGGASLIEVPINSDTDQVQAGWVITFNEGATRTVSGKIDGGSYYAITFNDANPGGTLYPLTIQSADYSAAVEGVISLTPNPLDENAKTWTFSETGNLTVPGNIISSTSTGLTLGANFDVRIIADYTDNNRTWTFNGSDGSLRFPDNTIQTTAFTGTDFTGYATEEFVTTRGYLTATDVAGFINAESDPIFSTSTAASITATNVSNWNTAYLWGDHASAGYLVPTINTTSTSAVSLANTSTANLDVTIGKAYILYKVETSHASWVRMYTDAASRSADSTRQQGQDPSLGSGVIAEVITTGTEVVLLSPGINGFNNENPITSVMPLAVTNLSGSENTVTVTITKLTLVP